MRSSKRSGLTLFAVSLLAVTGTSLSSQGQSQSARSRAEETLEWWNHIGNKLIAMAKDFPEDKYDFKVQKDERTFAENILHAAGVDYIFMNALSSTKLGPDLGKDPENPSRSIFKTKADVVKLMEQATADGAALIKQLGDAGLNNVFKYPFGNRMAHASSFMWGDLEHCGEHLGQLVVYFRAKGMVPPQSRPQTK